MKEEEEREKEGGGEGETIKKVSDTGKLKGHDKSTLSYAILVLLLQYMQFNNRINILQISYVKYKNTHSIA